MFSPNKLPQDFRFFFLGGGGKKTRIQGEKKETHQEQECLLHFYVYLCKCSTETFFISQAPNPTGALLLPSTTPMMMMMMMHACAAARVAEAAGLLTPLTSEREQLDLHKHYVHYSH